MNLGMLHQPMYSHPVSRPLHPTLPARPHTPTGRDRASSTPGRHLTIRMDPEQLSRRKGRTAPPTCLVKGSASTRCARYWTRERQRWRPLLWPAGGTVGERFFPDTLMFLVAVAVVVAAVVWEAKRRW